LQGGDLGYVSEEELRQTFTPQVAATLMDPKFPIGQLQMHRQGANFIFLNFRSEARRTKT
jgi:hypothetical protein